MSQDCFLIRIITIYRQIHIIGGNRFYDYEIKFEIEQVEDSFDSSISDGITGTANEIEFGKEYSGFVGYEDSIDYYKVTLPSAGKLDIFVESMNMDYEYDLYDSNGNRLHYGYIKRNSVSGKATVDWAYGLRKGTYYYSIKRYNKRGGTYTTKTSFVSAEETFTDDGTDDKLGGAYAIALNTAYKGQISSWLKDVDYYAFQLTSTVKCQIDYESQFKSGMRIYDGNGNKYWSGETSYNNAKECYILTDWVTLAPGTYYFYVESVPVDKSLYSGNYSFTISECKPEPAPGKVILTKVKSPKKKKLSVSWNNISDASGYYIQYSTSKKFKNAKNIHVGAGITKKTIKGLKRKKKYYVRVRAYKMTDEGIKYGAWSNRKAVKIK